MLIGQYSICGMCTCMFVFCISLVMNFNPTLSIVAAFGQRELSWRVDTCARPPAAALRLCRTTWPSFLQGTQLQQVHLQLPSLAQPDKGPWLCPPWLPSHSFNSLEALGTSYRDSRLLPYSQLQTPQGTMAVKTPSPSPCQCLPETLLDAALPEGAGDTQRWPPDQEQHFWSPGQSVSRLHGGLDGSGCALGQTPGLDANSLDRFRAGEGYKLTILTLTRHSWQSALPTGDLGSVPSTC